MSTIPFLKWAGGKRWLVQSNAEVVPQHYKRYFEPFLGSGAVFFHLLPPKAVLADINYDLINAYNAIKENWREVFRHLQEHHKFHCKDYYYKIRASTFVDAHESAAQFIYLNRTCWNGLYRVNKKGWFNVPVGTKKNVLLESDDFEKIALSLKGIDVMVSDFAKTIDAAESDDFIFVDPPYVTNHNVNGFVKYNEKIFSWKDQERLADAVKSAAERGVKITILNANHHSLRDLYKEFTQTVLKRPNVIAGKASSRGPYEELLIRTW